MSSFTTGRELTIDTSGTPSPWVTSSQRRVLDISIAALAVVFCLPLFLLAAVAVRLSSKGPVLFRQRRMGRFGQEFTLYKFRSMVADQRHGPSITVRGDVRVTAVGAFLRSCKLDELPQLWNVLKGDMSLVGPRPKLPHHEGLHLTWRPGITGSATLAFRDEEDLLADIPEEELEEVYENHVKPAKARLDFEYVHNATFGSDCGIIWKTVASCVFPWINPLAFSGEFLERSLSGRNFRITSQGNSADSVPSIIDEQLSSSQGRSAVAWQLSLLLMVLLPILAAAQQTGHDPSASSDGSRIDIFGGYSDWLTHGSVDHVPFEGSPIGATANIAWYLNRSLGVQLEGKYTHHESGTSLMSTSIGPIMRFPKTYGFDTFAHALIGSADIAGPDVPYAAGTPGFGAVHQEFATWGPQLTLGAGIDYDLPWVHHYVAWGVLQADYLFDHVKFGPGQTANLNSASLSTGIVVHLGSAAPPPVALACSATPETIFPGEPIMLTGIATQLDPKKKASYVWNYQGGVIPGSEPIATVDTANLQPGQYTVVGRVTEGLKAGQAATCTTHFTVQKSSNRSAGLPVR